MHVLVSIPKDNVRHYKWEQRKQDIPQLAEVPPDSADQEPFYTN